ncbi:hypothetical protein BH09ACT12_BH09ACT12_11030 [soil metagenome]
MTTGTETQAPMISVVDAEPDMRDLARLLLEIDGLSVIEAGDGAEALEQFFSLKPPPVPAAVVLDNRMPGMSGLEVAERMLSHNPGQVIILFSAHLDRNFEAQAKELGVAECISKVDARHLPSVVRRLLSANPPSDA